MKYIFYLLLLSQVAQAQQSRFHEGETVYVWALSGLNMRKLPDAKSEKIAALPYGTKVVVQPNIGIMVAHEVEEFKDFKVKGVWLLVKYGDKVGFVFDGYMSRLVAPSNECYDKSPMSLNYYLKNNYQPTTKVREDKDKMVGKYNDSYRPKPTFQQFDCGIIVRTKPASDGFSETTYEIQNATFYEGYVLGKYCFFSEMQPKYIKFKKSNDNHFYLDYYNAENGCSFIIEKRKDCIVISGVCYC